MLYNVLSSGNAIGRLKVDSKSDHFIAKSIFIRDLLQATAAAFSLFFVILKKFLLVKQF